MPYAGNAHFGFGDTVDHDVRGKIGNHQLARSHPLPRPAPQRVIGEPFDGFRDSGFYALGSIGVIFGNVVMMPREVLARGRCPSNTHYCVAALWRSRRSRISSRMTA